MPTPTTVEDIPRASQCAARHAATTFVRVVRKVVAELKTVRLLKLLLELRKKQQGVKYALLIGIKYGGWPKPDRLRNTQADVRRMRQLLIDKFGFEDENVIVMLDGKKADPHGKPTRANILWEIRRMTGKAQPGDTLLLHYAGHGSQLPRRFEDGNERGGHDQYIVPCDALNPEDKEKIIRDDVLYRLLPDSMPAGCRFIAIMDCCHSGTSLDLFHDKCNCFQGVGACIRRALRRGREELAAMTRRELVMDRGSPVMDFKVITGAFKTAVFGDARPCSGLCMRSRMLGSTAICISACQDAESTFEAAGMSFTTAIISVLDENPDISFRKLGSKAQSLIDKERKRLNKEAEEWRVERYLEHRASSDGSVHASFRNETKRWDQQAWSPKVEKPGISFFGRFRHPGELQRQTLQISSSTPLNMGAHFPL
ncbi:caspase domain-containing protein [Schizophyllum commune]